MEDSINALKDKQYVAEGSLFTLNKSIHIFLNQNSTVISYKGKRKSIKLYHDEQKQNIVLLLLGLLD